LNSNLKYLGVIKNGFIHDHIQCLAKHGADCEVEDVSFYALFLGKFIEDRVCDTTSAMGQYLVQVFLSIVSINTLIVGFESHARLYFLVVIGFFKLELYDYTFLGLLMAAFENQTKGTMA
jgi:hypothetical protein